MQTAPPPEEPTTPSVPAGGLRLLVAGLVLLLTVLGGLMFFSASPWSSEAGDRLQAAEQLGKMPAVSDCVEFMVWPAALLGMALVAALLATVRWWGRRVAALPGPGSAANPGRTVLLVLLGVTVLAAVPRVPRLFHSFWNDEETTMQDYAWGEWRPKSDGSWRFRPAPWQDTLFYNRGGSNHVLNSVLTRLTLEAADAIDSRPRGRFSEAVARMAPFLASLGTVFLLGWMVARAGHPVAGVVAAAVLALHPWHLRYSTEIRGYSVMLLAALGMVACLVAALRTGRHRAWAGFAFCEAAMLLAFPGALYLAAAANGLAALRVLFAKPGRWVGLARLAAWNLLAAVPVLLVIAPSLPQFSYYLDEGKRMIAFVPNWGWEKDFLSHVTAGVPPRDPAPGESLGLAMDGLWAPARLLATPWSVVLALGGVAVGLWRGPSAVRLLVLSLVSALVLGYAHNRWADNPTMPWYFLHAALLLAAGLGLAAEGVWRTRPLLLRMALALPAGAVLLAWLISALQVDARLATVPRQPLRETVEVMRGAAPTYGERGDREALTATFGTSAKRLRTYDPAVETLKTPADLDDLVRRADAEGRTLWVAFCGRRVAAEAPPDDPDRILLQRVESEDEGFRFVTRVVGMEELFSYRIYRREPEKRQE